MAVYKEGGGEEAEEDGREDRRGRVSRTEAGEREGSETGDRNEWGEAHEEVCASDDGKEAMEKGCLQPRDTSSRSVHSHPVLGTQARQTDHSALPNPFPTKLNMTHCPASHFTPSATSTSIRIARSSNTSTTALAGPIALSKLVTVDFSSDRRRASSGAIRCVCTSRRTRCRRVEK